MTFRKFSKNCIKKPFTVHRLHILGKRSVSLRVIIQYHCNVIIAAPFLKRTINPVSVMTCISACAFKPSVFTSLRDPPHSRSSILDKEWIGNFSIILSSLCQLRGVSSVKWVIVSLYFQSHASK